MTKLSIIFSSILKINIFILTIVRFLFYILFVFFIKTINLLSSLVTIVMQKSCIKLFDLMCFLGSSIPTFFYKIIKIVISLIVSLISLLLLIIQSLIYFIFINVLLLVSLFKKTIYKIIFSLTILPFLLISFYLYIIDTKKTINSNSISIALRKTSFIKTLFKTFYKELVLNKFFFIGKITLNKILNIILISFQCCYKKIRLTLKKIIFILFFSIKNTIYGLYNSVLVGLLLLKNIIYIILSLTKKQFWLNSLDAVFSTVVFLKKIKTVVYKEFFLLKRHLLDFCKKLLYAFLFEIFKLKKMFFYIKRNLLSVFSAFLIVSFLIYGTVIYFSHYNKYEKIIQPWKKSVFIFNSPELFNKLAQSDFLKPVIYYKDILRIENGYNLYDSLLDKGIDNGNVATVTHALDKHFDLTKINPLWEMQVIIASYKGWNNDRIHKLTLPVSKDYDLIIEADNDYNYLVYNQEKKYTRYMLRRSILIEDNIYDSLIQEGLTPSLSVRLLRILSWDIDFQREIRNNDTLEVVFECLYDEKGGLVECDNILFVSLDSNRDVSFYKYKNDYYHSNGQSVIKTLVKTPINNARMSSGFGNRKHPVLGYTALHKGVDFAAPIGTPIYASGDGVVDKMYRSKTYGNYIRVRHNQYLSSVYAHLNSYAKDIKVGTRVKQWQVIGYVGATGRVTGPHLHYEVLVNGKQVNPLSIKMPSDKTLSEQELEQFRDYQYDFNTIVLRVSSRGKVISPIASNTEETTVDNHMLSEVLNINIDKISSHLKDTFRLSREN